MNQESKLLLEQQLTEWDLASANYAGLERVEVKRFVYQQTAILVQFNPQRIVSSAAKVDAKSIEARPCFLCEANRPPQQRGLAYKDDYTILINPFPIFPQHLTIPRIDHVDQRILPYFADMVDLSEDLSDFVIFYNGPKCGASAPDHFHFQAGNKDFLPIVSEFSNGEGFNLVTSMGSFHSSDTGNRSHVRVDVYSSCNYLRGTISLKSTSKAELCRVFEKLYRCLELLQPGEAEPMVNILSYKEGEYWVVHVFPRRLHRPDYYFREGAEQIILSPASVDMGGVFITPRKEDFEKITSGIIEDIFNQVCLPENELLSIIEQMNH